MSQLQKSNNQAERSLISYKSPLLRYAGQEISLEVLKPNKSELKLIHAINYQLIRDFTRHELLDQVFIVVSNNLRALGSKMKAEDQLLMVNDFCHELINRFPHLSIKEFEVIITAGIRGEFEINTVGLSIVNFNLWTQKYLDKKYKLQIEINNKLQRQKVFDSPEQPIDQNSILNILRNDYLVHWKKKYPEFSHSKKIIDHEIRNDFDDYYLKNGNFVGAGFVYPYLLRFHFISTNELRDEIKRIDQTNALKSWTAKNISLLGKDLEAKRRICCRVVLNLRDERLNK
jgi:hypothetical protein